MPDLFIYLERASGARKGRRLSYLRFSMRDLFIGLENSEVTKRELAWHQLRYDANFEMRVR